ncbi:MAG: hypothetical protein LIO62_04355 [Clostridiales bacterium]|nr:hypothetical protein [Clostridiales bacterium]
MLNSNEKERIFSLWHSKTRKKKNKLTSAIAVGLAAVMLIGGASYAYLEDSDGDIVNNFSTNKVEVDIDETTGEDYDIVPGTSQDKDPTVTVDNTVDAYVFVRVTDTTEGLVEYAIADGWTLLDGTDDIYYRIVGADDEDKTFSILDGDKVSYSADLVNSDMLDDNGNLKDGIELTFSTYAIQVEGFDTAIEAFAQVNDEVIEVMTYDELVEAVSTSDPGVTVVMLNDIDGTYTMPVQNAAVTVDLAGYTLSINPDSGYAVVATEDITFTNGDLSVVNYIMLEGADCSVESVDISCNGGIYVTGSGSEVTIDADSTLIGPYACTLYPQTAGYTGDVVLNVYGTIEATNKYYAISENYWSGNDYEIIVNIYDGAVVKSSSAAAIYSPAKGEINVYGGEVTGYCGIFSNYSTVNIYGGTITGTQNDTGLDNANGIYGAQSYDGSGVIICLATHSSYYGDVELNVYDGTIISNYSYAVRCFATSTSNSTGKHATVNLEGGTYDGALGDLRLVDNLTDSGLGFYTLNDSR